MANVIKHKRGSGSDPSASDLILGELAIRTDTGKLFTKMDSGAIAEIAGGGSDIAINTLSSSSATGGGSATFNGSAYRFTLSAPPSVSAQQLLVSINGVIQKPVAGTGQPSEGFSVDRTDIILGDAPATGSDFFILTFKSLGVSEPADNSVTSAKIVDGAIVNADINASAAIAGTKISPDFGSQTLTTTGTVNTGLINASSASDQILNLNSSDNGAVYLAFKRSGGRKAYFGYGGTGSTISLANEISDGDIIIAGNDGGSNINMLSFNTSENGRATFVGNVNVGAGLDVTGDITVTGTVDGVDIAALNTTVSGKLSNIVEDTSPQLGGNLDVNTKNIVFGDSGGTTDDRLVFGAGSDLQIYHNGNESKIEETGTGGLRINTSALHINKGDQSETMANFTQDGSVELYHDNSKKFETTSAGVEIHNDLLLDGSANLGNYIRTNYDGGGHMYFRNNSGSSLNFSSHFQTYRDTDEGGTVQTHIHYYHGGYCELLHQGDSVIRTLTNGVQFRDEGAVKGQFTDQGLCFGTDTAAANALNAYEEGTFTPNYNTTASNLTLNGTSSSSASVYHARKGSYVKIGKRVWFQISLATNGLTSVGGSDFIALDGLPFTAENDSNRPRFVMACQAGRFDTTNTFVPLFLVVNPGTTLCQLRQDFDTQKTISSFNVTGSSNRNVIEAFGSYEVA